MLAAAAGTSKPSASLIGLPTSRLSSSGELLAVRFDQRSQLIEHLFTPLRRQPGPSSSSNARLQP